MQLIRFGAVGIVNTLVDFGVLNLLLMVVGNADRQILVVSNAAAFLAANLNSYLMNRQWTFRDRRRPQMSQYIRFLAFSMIGLAINSAVLVWLSTWMAGSGGIDALDVNLAKAAATGASMAWNYLTYRYWVFGRVATEASRREEAEFF